MQNVAIIGSGPAGLTAAIYTARANLTPLLIQGAHAGGQLTLTTEVENYPGFHHAIMGPDLIKEMRAQAERFGTEFISGDVTSVDVTGQPLRLTIEGEHSIDTKTLIIATGASAIWLGIPGESTLMGHGVSSCATYLLALALDIPSEWAAREKLPRKATSRKVLSSSRPSMALHCFDLMNTLIRFHRVSTYKSEANSIPWSQGSPSPLGKTSK